jgi:hypothetical protein
MVKNSKDLDWKSRKNFGDVAGLLIESEILTLLTLMNTLKETGRQVAAPL